MDKGLTTIFDIHSDLYTKRSGGTLCDDDSFKRIWSTFMLTRILRMNPSTINLALRVQELEKAGLTPKDIYLFLYARIPRRAKAPYFQFIKKPKKAEEKKKKVKTKGGYEVDGDGFMDIR